jgi:hypothetical protein
MKAKPGTIDSPEYDLGKRRSLRNLRGSIAVAEVHIIPFADQKDAIDTALRVDGVSGHPGGHEYPDGTSERIAKFFAIIR